MCALLPLGILTILSLKVQIYRIIWELVTGAGKVADEAADTDPEPQWDQSGTSDPWRFYLLACLCILLF